MKTVDRNVLVMACLMALSPTQACAKQAPQAAQTQTVVATQTTTRSPLGTGVDGLVSFSTELPLNDIFKSSARWMSGTEENWDDKRPLNLDEHGWVKSLRPGRRVVTLMMWGPAMWVGGKHRAPPGRYTVDYEGEGTIEYSGATVVETNPGRDVLELCPEEPDGWALMITATNPRNYIRNIRVLLPNAKPGEMFNPAFIESMRGYKMIRFLGWMTGPSAEDINAAPYVWSNMPKIDDASWESGKGGPPLEVMIDLCNRLQIDPWFSIHHLADDEFVRNFAEAMKPLGPGRKVYIEHSNEVWNGSFAQHEYAEQRGMERQRKFGFPEDAYTAGILYNVHRTREIGAIFREVLGRDRVVVVLAGQSNEPDIMRVALTSDNIAADIDAITTAPYFGFEFGTQEMAAAVEKMTLDDLFRELETKTLPETLDYVARHAEIARRYKLPLIGYEGGQHLVDLSGQESPHAKELFDAANRDPRMGALYTRLLSEWNRLTGGQLFTHMMHCGQAGSGGRWGLIEYQGQPRSEAPKYDAVMKWMEAGH